MMVIYSKQDLKPETNNSEANALFEAIASDAVVHINNSVLFTTDRKLLALLYLKHPHYLRG